MNDRDTNRPFDRAAETGRAAADEANRAGRLAAEKAAAAGEQVLRAGADAAGRNGEAAQDAMKAGLNTASHAFQQVTDQFTRTLGFAEPKAQELSRRSSQNLEAVTQAAAVLTQGAQEISREWFGLVQERIKKNMDGLNALTRCRSVQDVVAVQSDLARDNLQQAIDTGRRVAELSVEITGKAARTIQARDAA
jgi:hypothetical protein